MTQKQKIVTLMARYDRWFLPKDFMQNNLGGLFVGYEATARLAELRGEYPEMLSTKPEGKFKKSRLNRESVDVWFQTLPKDLRQIVAKELDHYPHIPKPQIEQPKPAVVPTQASLL